VESFRERFDGVGEHESKTAVPQVPHQNFHVGTEGNQRDTEYS
jgi:hypothetical protein